MSTSTQNISIKEVYEIFAKRSKLFWGSVIVVACGVITLWAIQPVSYKVSVLLDIARIKQSVVSTDEYAYDGYYRIQADEQFAETVAHWLRTPRVVDDVLQAAEVQTRGTLRARERFFASYRISPQSISVTYSVADPAVGVRIVKAMEEQLNTRTTALNDTDVQWFTVRVSEPVIARNQKSLAVVSVVGLVIGFCIATFLVLIVHATMPSKGRIRKRSA